MPAPAVVKKETDAKFVRECRFAFHLIDKEGNDDLHYVKEAVHQTDGSRTPNVRLLLNYKRPYWIAKKAFRNYEQKRERISLDHVDRFESTQRNLLRSAATSLGTPWFRGSMRDLQNSPYLYGTDITSTALIRQGYKERWNILTPYSYATTDVETDVVRGTDEIIMQVIVMESRAVLVAQEIVYKGYANPLERLRACAEKYLARDMKENGLTVEFMIVPTEIDVVKTIVGLAHEWKPDFLGVHNLLFDMEKMIAACKRAGVEPEDIFNDPKLPRRFRHFNFKIGPAKKITSSGRVMTYKPSDRWHTVESPASFYWVCSMGGYRRAREGQKEETSYGLDHLLGLTIQRSKMKFDLAGELDGLAWHQYMQANHPFEYSMYCIFDGFGMILMERKTRDMTVSIPTFAESSDYSKMSSQPRRTMDALHLHLLKYENSVVGTTGSVVETPDDKLVVSCNGWITALPSENVVDNGLQLIAENPNMRTNIRTNGADLDVAGAYPTNEVTGNNSKETTVKEMISIEGTSDYAYRQNSLNLSGGQTNAVQFCIEMLGYPTQTQMLEQYLVRRNSILIPR